MFSMPSLFYILRLTYNMLQEIKFFFHLQIFVEGLLRSGSKENISIAEELITPSKIGGLAKKQEHHLTSALYLLKYDVSVTVALEAAKEYFNSAMSMNDSSMELAK